MTNDKWLIFFDILQVFGLAAVLIAYFSDCGDDNEIN